MPDRQHPRIVVYGGPRFGDPDALFGALDRVWRKYPGLQLVSRKIRVGTDPLALDWAESNDVPVLGFRAAWLQPGHVEVFSAVEFPGDATDLRKRLQRARVPIWAPCERARTWTPPPEPPPPTFEPDPTPPQAEMFPQVCACGAPATRLCDYVLRPPGPDVATCSRPMCDACVGSSSTAIVCTRSGRGKGCRHITIDYCAEHASQLALRSHPPQGAQTPTGAC